MLRHEVVHRAGHDVRRFHIDISGLAVPPGHLQAGVPQKPLQGEDVPPAAQKPDRCGVAKRMRAAPDPMYARFAPVAGHYLVDAVLGHRPAVVGEKQVIVVRDGRFGAVPVHVVPQDTLHCPAHRHLPFLAALAHDLDQAFIEPQVVERNACQFGYPEGGVKQGEGNSQVTVALGRARVDNRQKLLQLQVGEGGDHLSGRLGYLHLEQRVCGYDLLRGQPGPEGP